MTDLRTDVRDYYGQIASDQDPVDASDVFALRDRTQIVDVDTDAGPTSRIRTAPIAAIAAAVGVLVIGIVPFLVGRDSGSPPATSPVVVPTTTMVPVQVGEWLVFSAVPYPNGEGIGDGVWFDGAFYALGEHGQIYVTSDGMKWDAETRFDEYLPDASTRDSFVFTELVTDGERLVVLGESVHDEVGGERCAVDGHLVSVIVVDSVGVVTSSEVAVPLPDVDGCRTVNVDIVAGAQGLLISGSVATPPSNDIETAVGLFSDDGIDWIDLEGVGPFHSSQVAGVLATSDAFYAVPVGSDVEGPVFYSVDGLSWAVTDALGVYELFEVDVWDGQMVMRTPDGLSNLRDPRDILIPDELIATPVLHFGEMGVFGTGNAGMGRIPAQDEFTFSRGGVIWQTWTPQELADIDGLIRVIGIGDAFVVLGDYSGRQLWIGVPTS